MQTDSNEDKLIFKQTRWITLIIVVALFFGAVTVLSEGHAPVGLYIFVGLVFLILVLLMFIPRIIIYENSVQRRYFFGYSSHRVNLTELRSVSSWFALSRGGRSNYLKLVDTNNNKVTISFGSELGPPTWNNENELRKTLAMYIQKSDADVSRRTESMLGLRSK